MIQNPDWWRGAVIYQIYPRSFKDTSGNGIGDLKGITEKMDYIAGLGVDGLWISPFLKSPQADYGYDISDYYQIDPLFGDMDDFKAMLEAAHERGLKLIMDMVLSHTSDQHVWFTESKMSRDNPKADWYVWADPKADGSPPNNWLSVFGGSAWQYYPLRGQYYLHNFLKEQPDLNFHNPDVMAEMLKACRHWLDLGVDGFRLDVINYCFHDKFLRDNPQNPNPGSSHIGVADAYNMQFHMFNKTQPENIEFLQKLRALLNEYPERFAVAEIHDDEQIKTSCIYTGGEDHLHTAYNFSLLGNVGALPPARHFIETLQEQDNQFETSWPSWAFSNHDVIRAASRWSGTKFKANPALSQMLPILLTSLRGTAFLYQGEELGLPEADIPYEKLLDPWGLYLWPQWQGRDGCRTPMPWSDEPGKAGFSKSEKTWLPIPDGHLPLSVAEQEKDEGSTLHIVRDFLNWRKDHPALKTGEIEFLGNLPEPLLGFTRSADEETIFCLFNLSGEEQRVSLLDIDIPPETTPALHNSDIKIGEQDCTLPAYRYCFIVL